VTSRLESSYRTYRVTELIDLFESGRLNLEPAFQRKSVWSITDRRRLVQSIVNNYPVPSLFFHHRRDDGGEWTYDVLDGKQRLETLLMFMRQGRYARGRFEVPLDLGDGERAYSWREIVRKHPRVRQQIEEYEVPVVRVDAIDFAQIRDLFVRINSTGRRLTSGEIRHARFYDSNFLKEAATLAARSREYLKREKVLSEKDYDRMKGTELFAELLMSIHAGSILNKKKALDAAIGREVIGARELRRISRECTTTLGVLKQVLPDLGTTRFHKIADFYSLFMVLWELRQQRCVLSDRERNRAAAALLTSFSTSVDRLSDRLRKAERIGEEADVFKEYLLSVREGTDSAANREKRARILKSLLGTLFDSKDARRTFTPEQRRILWNSDEKKACRGCGAALTWNNFTADHRMPHSKGGKTVVTNAQLMCNSCNSSKGARRAPSRRTRAA